MVIISGHVQGQGALPLVQPNGDLAVVYEDAIGPPFRLYAQTSHDGGLTFTRPRIIARDEWRESHGMRTGFGIPAAAVDPVTGEIFVVWQDGRFRSPLNDIFLVRSADGRTWGAPVRVNQDPEESQIDHLTSVVAAFAGDVHVTYFTRDDSLGISRFLNERYIVSHDGGVTFGNETVVGDPIDLAYAASVFNLQGGLDRFLGDYNGIAAGPGGVRIVWCRASRPPHPETYHQTTWTATLVER